MISQETLDEIKRIDRIKDEERRLGYYRNEIKKLFPINDEYRIKIQLISSTYKTKYLNLNEDCIEVLKELLEKL